MEYPKNNPQVRLRSKETCIGSVIHWMNDVMAVTFGKYTIYYVYK